MQARNSSAPFGTPADVFIYRWGKDRGFVRLSSRGDVPDGASPGFVTTLPSGRSLLAFQKAGVFELILDL